MEQKDQLYRYYSKMMPIEACDINLKDLKNLYDKLDEKKEIAIESEHKAIDNFALPKEEKEKMKENVKEWIKVNIMVAGTKGERLASGSKEVFDKINFEISSIRYDNYLVFEYNTKMRPKNYFEIALDFTKPKISDFSSNPGKKTPNESRIIVAGMDEVWTNGIYSIVKDYFKERSSLRQLINSSGIYDIILWLIVIPYGFIMLNKLINYLKGRLNIIDSVLFVFIGLYFMVSLILIWRVFFGFVRWLFPPLEYISEKRNKRLLLKGFVWILFLGIVVHYFVKLISILF
ncbi:MAG: hypothetical protein HWN66_20525 [Candidatus Helarchaeota archaeon]|nr:hypothetical protein [Candidatus Helarchaeota archaeon]